MTPRGSRLTSAAAAAVTAAAMLAGCGVLGGSAASDSTKPILVGISLSLTGGFSADGQAFERGYRLWQDDVNSHGGLIGRQVKLIILDDNSSPTKVVTNYKKLITVDHVELTFGPFSSLLTKPAAQAVAPYGYAMIEGAGAAESVFRSQSNLKYHNIFCPSLPVRYYMTPFTNWIKSLPPGQRPKTAAYPSSNDPFALPAVLQAQKVLQGLGVKTVYTTSKNLGWDETSMSAIKASAQATASSGAQLVVLGSTAVPTVSAFMKTFEQNKYLPKIFIATAGPDQGQAFLGKVGKANADGVMVPGGWYGEYANPLSNVMVEDYIAHYGGTAASINADVAEAYSVGQVAADAVTVTGGTDNAKIIKYLHNGVTLETVQGSVLFDSLGENPGSVGFISQWQNGNFLQVLPPGVSGSSKIWPVKPAWGV
ncbi:MAG TPA: amino acid ABC transporter substrate-binding protein [Streptosporangiaceae bacterium]